jgi:myo-inositol-1(or 4)-monophosphatase
VAPTRQSLEQIRTQLKRAVLLAGQDVRGLFKSGKFSAHEKQDHTPVTEADTRAEGIIRRELARRHPGIPVVSEEDEKRPYLGSLEEFFLLDPIDGTWNFAAGIPVFFISLAYLRGGLPRVGVMHNPVSRELLLAVEGAGAFRSTGPPSTQGTVRGVAGGVRLRTAPYRPLSDCQVHRHDRRLDPVTAIRILERIVLKAQGVRDLGSTTTEMALIASGRSDALVGYYVANWDVAAASLILKESGGVVTRLDGNPIDFTGAEKFSICAAGNPRLHQELLSAIA